VPQAPCGAGLRPLTPTRQVATILYRLEGVTMGFNQHRHNRHFDWRLCDVCMEALPIPYTLTDFGRTYLLQLKLMEALEVEAAAAHSSNGLPLQRQAARRSHSLRKR